MCDFNRRKTAGSADSLGLERKMEIMSRVTRPGVASVIFAAGKGSRMVGYSGNKTLLPLVPGRSTYEGEHPLLMEVLRNLPHGPKGIVVNHCAGDVMKATQEIGASYLDQPQTNGTGGALLAARSFLESVSEDYVVITMGDVPLIRPDSYRRLVGELEANVFAVLAFAPRDRAQYGMLEMDEGRVLRITEWKYWHAYSPERQAALRFCNAGVYAARRIVLLEYMSRLARGPHHVQKKRGDQWVTIEEFFLTDLIELMSNDRLDIGVIIAPEEEVMGVDTPEALERAQTLFRRTGG
jgi:bifunctional N-acetylglucosamine-1-phosphate-uridyltransferase/glucosamine-1-phosphate-acetyltransferase GlmU-like protein